MSRVPLGPTMPPGEGWKELLAWPETGTLAAVHENGQTIALSRDDGITWWHPPGCGPAERAETGLAQEP